jgi:hypothetical protein
MQKARKHGSALLPSAELGLAGVSGKAATTCAISCASALACAVAASAAFNKFA